MVYAMSINLTVGLLLFLIIEKVSKNQCLVALAEGDAPGNAHPRFYVALICHLPIPNGLNR